MLPRRAFFAREKKPPMGSPSDLALNELSCNSPSGAIRISRMKKGGKKDRGSPYNGLRKSSRFATSYDKARSESKGASNNAFLLSPSRGDGDGGAFVAEKMIIVKKPNNDFEGNRLGLTFRTLPEQFKEGVVVSSLAEGGAAAGSELLVGDIILAVDGVTVKNAEEAVRCCTAARPGANIFLTAVGGTREVVLDKRLGDCGMTCAGAGYIKRGVLLKRIQQGSLADKAQVYCGDTILSVNGALINHHSECVKAIDAVQDIVRLVLLGESTEIRIPIMPAVDANANAASTPDLSDPCQPALDASNPFAELAVAAAKGTSARSKFILYCPGNLPLL